MKKLAILCFSILMITACSDDKESGSQNIVTDKTNYTHIGDIYSNFLGNSKIGDWRYAKDSKTLRVDINRELLNGTDLGSGQVVVPSHILGLLYDNGNDLKAFGNPFADSITVVLPADFACDLKNPAEAIANCLSLALYDASGQMIIPVIGEF